MNLGTHIFVDIKNANIPKYLLREHAFAIFNLMEKSIKENSNMKIVHKNLTIFEDEKETELGWTSVLLLDASHFSSHCYSERGLLAFDLFTCGNTDTEKVIDNFLNKIQLIFKEKKIIRYTINKRF